MSNCKGCINNLKIAQYDMDAMGKGKIRILEIFNEDGHLDFLDCIFYSEAFMKNWLL